VLGVLLFGLYIYSYQQLVTKGSLLADEHCIKINPLIIARKNSYLDEMKLIQASASAEEVQKSLQDYLVASNAYLSEEGVWLNKQREYLDSKMFKLLIPSYVKEAAEDQYQMYEADHKSSFYTSKSFSATNQEEQIDLMNQIVEETAKSKVAGDRYNEAWERNKGKTTWQYNFVKVPQSNCPADNFIIPDTDNPLSPKVPADTNPDVSG
jgi:uncharacterized protein YaaR (DUF327 family)